MLKLCTKCHVEKLVSEFSKCKKTKTGLQYWCKDCSNQYRFGNKEEKAKWEKQYQFDNKEKIAKNKKQYYIDNKEEKLKRQKQYYIDNKEKVTKRHKQYFLNNKEEILKYRKQYRKQYYQTEKGKNAERKASHKRRALKLCVEYEIFNPSEILERNGYKCQLCGKKTRPDYKNPNHPLYPNLDHIIPLSKGGAHTRLNTQCLCHQCNMEKGANNYNDQLRMFGQKYEINKIKLDIVNSNIIYMK